LTEKNGETLTPKVAQETLVIVQRRIAGLSDDALAKFVTRASRASGLRGAVNVLLTTGRELRALNGRFRGKDRPTDVLSFPPLLRSNGFAGDIAIAADIAVQNARRLGHSATEEIKILVLHGVLHLAGYDHEHDRGEMASKEQSMRRQLGLPEGLLERGERPNAVRSGQASAPVRTRTVAGSRRARARTGTSKEGKMR
jgi:probable rRNA maturation factor